MDLFDCIFDASIRYITSGRLSLQSCPELFLPVLRGQTIKSRRTNLQVLRRPHWTKMLRQCRLAASDTSTQKNHPLLLQFSFSPWIVLSRGMNTSVSKIAGSSACGILRLGTVASKGMKTSVAGSASFSASGISRLPLLTLFISGAMCSTSRSTRSAFGPETFKPCSRSLVFSFFTVNFCKLALVVSLPLGTATVCEPLMGRCKKHSRTVAIATNSLKRRDWPTRWRAMASKRNVPILKLFQERGRRTWLTLNVSSFTSLKGRCTVSLGLRFVLVQNPAWTRVLPNSIPSCMKFDKVLYLVPSLVCNSIWTAQEENTTA